MLLRSTSQGKLGSKWMAAREKVAKNHGGKGESKTLLQSYGERQHPGKI